MPDSTFLERLPARKMLNRNTLFSIHAVFTAIK